MSNDVHVRLENVKIACCRFMNVVMPYMYFYQLNKYTDIEDKNNLKQLR